MKKALYFFCLFFASTSLLAQNELTKKEQRKQRKQEQLNQTNRYFTLEILGTYRNVQDLATSNQIYNGFGGGIGFGGFQMRNNNIQEFRGRGGYNGISSRAGVSTDDFWGNFSYIYLRKLKNPKFFLGGQANFLSQVRYTDILSNSSLHWELVGSLGIAARAQSPFTIPLLKKQVATYAQVYLPLIAYVSRPIYGVTVSGEMEHYVSALGRLGNTSMEFGMHFPIRKNNANRLRIAYQWDFLRWRDNEVHKVVTGQHAISIGLLVSMIQAENISPNL
ncbi:MAG: hypothetical protein AAF599_06985 [Bacteroidota bacterium]